MAFNKAPTSIWPSYSSDGTNITIPIAALDGLTAAEANASTGDWREIALAFSHTLYRHYYGLAAADRPDGFVTTPPRHIPITSGDFEGGFRITYSLDFYTSGCTPDMMDEPA